ALLEAARLERDEIMALQRQLPIRSRMEVISEPMLPDSPVAPRKMLNLALGAMLGGMIAVFGVILAEWWRSPEGRDRKSTRLNSSHVKISYAVFCLKKKKK